MYRFWLAAMSLWSQRVSREGADKKYYVTMVKRAGRTDRGVTGTDPGRGDPPGTGVPAGEAKAGYLRERLPRARTCLHCDHRVCCYCDGPVDG